MAVTDAEKRALAESWDEALGLWDETIWPVMRRRGIGRDAGLIAWLLHRVEISIDALGEPIEVEEPERKPWE